MPFGDSCYSFHANAKTFHEAQELCHKHDKVLATGCWLGCDDNDNNDKVLVEIESQEENDMISELLFQSSLTATSMDQVGSPIFTLLTINTYAPLQVWTGGVGSFIARKSVWFWHSDTDKVMDFRNFWKGWTGGDRIDHSQLHNSQVRVIRNCCQIFLCSVGLLPN